MQVAALGRQELPPPLPTPGMYMLSCHPPADLDQLLLLGTACMQSSIQPCNVTLSGYNTATCRPRVQGGRHTCRLGATGGPLLPFFSGFGCMSMIGNSRAPA